MSDTDSPKNVRGKITTGRVVLQSASTNRSGRREYDCVFMQPGRVKRADQEESNWLIPASTIQAAEPLFNSVSSYLDHPELFGFGWHQAPQVEKLAGITFNARWSDEENAMLGSIRLYDQEPGSSGAFIGALLDQILADQQKDLEIPPVGLSAVLFHDTEFDEEEGIRISTEFRYIESIDTVYDAGAGGYVRAALSAAGPFRRVWNLSQPGADPPPTILGGENMSDNTFQSTVGGETDSSSATLPPSAAPLPTPELLAAIDRATQRMEDLYGRAGALLALEAQEPEPTPDPGEPEQNAAGSRLDDLTAAVERLTALQAEREEAQTVQGMGQSARLRGAMTGLDQVELAVEAMLAGTRPPDGIPPLQGIKSLYMMLSGDFEMTGIFQEDRVYLANVTTSTMAKLVADALNKRVVNEFQQYPQWWKPIMHVEDFASLQDVKWITLGGIGELPTVAEGAAYTEVTWDDIQQKDEFVKKGGYLGITMEAIDKDDTRRLQAAPRALAQAAWLTLSKSISAIFTVTSGTGPTVYYDDSNTRVLFHSSNSNLGSSALSWASWVATRTAMRQQTEHHSGERLGALTAPRFLLVPSDLEMAAIQYLASAGEPGTADNDINPAAQGEGREERLRRARERVIVVDLWTDADNWAAVADPRLWPSLGLAFRYGHTPEIFSVADPRAGLMFTNDVMPVKVRFFYATGPIDFRGLYKHNV